MPGTDIRTVRRRGQARDRAVHPGIEDSVAQHQQEAFSAPVENLRSLGRNRSGISLLPLPPHLSAFLLIDPISDMKRTILKRDPLRFAVGEKCHGVLVHERHVPQIERQLLPWCLDDEQLLDLLDIVRLHPATEGEHHLTVC